MIFLPKNVDSKQLLEVIIELGWDVIGILQSYSKNNESSNDFQSKLKIINYESGPVTSADLEISEFVKKEIKGKFPLTCWDFLSEEDVKNNKSKQFNSKWVWIIDPIDGTKDFINQTGEYAVHLALNHFNKVVLGVVLIPSKNQMWISFDGMGTWCETRDSRNISPIKINAKDLNELKIITSKTHMHKKFKVLIDELKPRDTIGLGSVGYKIVSLLTGIGDLYISYSLPGGSCPKDWDIAGPMALIKNAGGYFTDINGRDLEFLKEPNFEQKGILVASMNDNHKQICQRIKAIVQNNNLPLS